MRVCYIINGLRPGGKERQLLELIKGLINQSFLYPEQIMVISFYKNGGLDDVFEKLRVQIKYTPRTFKKDIFLIFKLYKIVKEFKPDIVHTWDSMTSFYAALLKFFRNFIFIDGSIRRAPPISGIPFKIKFLKSLNFLLADTVIANSKAGLISYKAPGEKSLVIHNGFSKARLENLENKDAIKERFSIKTNKVVGMVANFTGTKDYETFIACGKKILAKRKNVTFAAVGDGINLKKHKESAVNSSNIKFLGRQKNVESIINIFNVGVLSTFTEGISNSIMEYMALGKPVVAAAGGGTEELVIDGQTGFLVKQKSPAEMAEKIEYLLENEEIALKIGEAGKRRIETGFSSTKMVRTYIGLYKESTA